MNEDVDYTFHAMGSDVRLLIGRPFVPRAPTPLDAADREREFVLAFAHRLSRFHPGQRAVSPEPRPAFGGAGIRPAPRGRTCRAVGGRAQRGASRSNARAGAQAERLCAVSGRRGSRVAAAGPGRRAAAARPARPDPQAPWRRIKVDDERGVIVRPPGLMLDTGGTGKGLCADAVAYRLGCLQPIRRRLRRRHRRRRYRHASSNRIGWRSSTRSLAGRSARSWWHAAASPHPA